MSTYLELFFKIAVNMGAFCGIVSLLVDGMASFFIRVPAPNRVFWIVVALIVGINYWNKRNYHHNNRKSDQPDVMPPVTGASNAP